MSRRIFSCFVLVGVLFNNVNAQAPFFRNIVYDKEKRSATLSRIFQDNKGYMWLGTGFGICRYNGVNFQYFEKDSNLVTAMAESRNGILWMGHANGLIEYLQNDTVKKFITNKPLPVAKITDMVFDKQNRLWFSTYGNGIYCCEGNTLHNIHKTDGLTDDDVYDLLVLENDEVWAATDMGITVCTLSNTEKRIAAITDKNGLPDNIVLCMKTDAEGNVWIGMQDKGVCLFKKNSKTIFVPEEIKGWKYGQVNDILPMKREVLIGTEENGIIEIHSGLPLLNKMKPSKKKKITSIKQLLLDKDEQVWVVADNLLSLANCNRFELIEIPPEWQDAVKAITADNTGRIWFSNAKGFFTKKDNNNPLQKITLPGSINYAAIVCLYADDNSNVWIGTYNDGLYQYTPGKHTLKRYTKANGLVDDNVFSISGNEDEIWLGTLGGASKLTTEDGKTTFENYTKSNGLSNNYVYDVFIDNKGNKWFATDGSGICKLDTNGFHHYSNIWELHKNIVYTITQDIYNNIWFTGRNSGLFEFDGEKFKRYTIKDGLHDNEILNLTADNNGNLLLAHPDGLEIFNIKKEYFTFYGAESGFESINPQINAFCKTKKNTILVGAEDKIVQYYSAGSYYKPFPKTVMNSVSIFFKPVDFANKKQFSYNENHITFDYAGIWYLNPEAVNYRYMLEGYSKEWINTKDHIITFPNLPPGNYTFKIKASINNDFRYASTVSWSFEIDKPFWKTGWFIILSLLIAGLAVYYFVRLRIRLIRYQQEKEKQQLVTRLEMLKNQLNPHFLFNSFNTLMNIIEKDKQQAMDFTERLSDFYREIVLVQDKQYVTVKEELTLLQHYIYLLRSRFNNQVYLQLNITAVHENAFIPPLTLQLLAENAIKHNTVDEQHPLIIKIDSAQFFLVVSNNISNHKETVRSAGIGLKNIKQRVQMLTGREVQVIQTENEFSVIIPLK